MKRVWMGIMAVIALQVCAAAADTATVRVADGFDYPVGKPDAHGYYKARGFVQGGHLGEDWDCNAGGDHDLGDPVYCIGNGTVVFAADVFLGWGNVVIVRHGYYENGQLVCVDSLYGHLNEIKVKPGDAVTRGQEIGTIGTAHGMYPAHLHFEIRKNLTIGMNRSAFAPDFANYYDPTKFIDQHRTITVAAGSETAAIAVNTFSHPANRYSGPSGVRYAGGKYYGAGDGKGGSVTTETVEFSFSSGDEPVVVKVKTKRVASGGQFKVSRYEDLKARLPPL